MPLIIYQLPAKAKKSCYNKGMPIWLLVISVLIPQEFASSAIVFIIALQNNFPIWAINLIWICTTLLDMYVGYMLGKFTQEKFHGTRFFHWVERWIKKGEGALGKHGEKLSLALFGVIDFPYVNAFLGAWIGLPLNMTLLLTLTGNFIWYLFLWGTVLGLSAFISNPDIIILILLVAGALSHFLFKLSKSNKG
jgi:membrane protein YqaA with SNARE-associated domain